MSKTTILMIEDEKNIVEILKYNLEQSGYRLLVSADGRSGFECAVREKPDLILLDLMLPEMDGYEVCRLLRQNYKTRVIPILILTAKSEEADEILGFEFGADDYVTKPFGVRQILARIKSLLRRSRTQPERPFLKAGRLEIDTARFQARLAGKALELTFKEYSVLKLLMESGGRVLSRERILEEVWGHDESFHVEPRVVDKHIGELRRKLRQEASRIVTVMHSGYRLDTDEEEKEEGFTQNLQGAYTGRAQEE